MSQVVATCKTCNVSKPTTAFETMPNGHPRGECKSCRQTKRLDVVKAARDKHNPDKTPKPTACSKCGKGPAEVEFKWRSDVKSGGWRPDCNSCYNAKGYCEKYRAEQLAVDAVAYRKRNAESHLEWAHRNPDKVREQQIKTATEAARKIKALKTNAAQRSVVYIDADGQLMADKFSSPCHFCEFVPSAGESLNGLDRVDSAGPYSDANTVACCATCNAMKNVLVADEFVYNVRKIAAFTNADIASGSGGEVRQRLPAFGGRAELRDAPAKTKEDQLTVNEKIDIWSSPCYLCGRTPSFGIDRQDASGDYTLENARPCCTWCNYMKKDLGLEDFKTHIVYINRHTAGWVLGDVEHLPLAAIAGKEREPVAVCFTDDSAPAIVFPSIGTAERIAGLKRTEIANTRFRACGVYWVKVSTATYKQQTGLASYYKDVITRLRTLSMRNTVDATN